MKVIRQLHNLKKDTRPIVLAAGFFDGVHSGHRQVIAQAVAKAESIGGQAWVLTFDKHPLKLLCPSRAPLLLTSVKHKLKLLENLNVSGCFMLSFTQQLADTKPADFIRLLCASVTPLVEIFVGHNWRFGHRGKGDIALLRKMANEHNFRLTALEPVRWQGKIISSTRIRNEILRGKLADAEAMLGRPFSIVGTVFSGRAVGRKLGFPTANLDPHGEVLPPSGVYAVRATVDERSADGVLYIGCRPTFLQAPGGVNAVSIELHLFDLRPQLYGNDIEVSFAAWLRNERKFRSPAELAAGIARDVAAARAVLANQLIYL